MSGNPFLPMFKNSNIKEVKLMSGSEQASVFILCMSYASADLFETKIQESEMNKTMIKMQQLKATTEEVGVQVGESKIEHINIQTELMALSICDNQGRLLLNPASPNYVTDRANFDAWIDSLSVAHSEEIYKAIKEINTMFQETKPSKAWESLSEEEQDEFRVYYADKHSKKLADEQAKK